MRLRRITLQHLRNIPFADLSADGLRQFVLGRNGQGKSNLLEAIGFLTALRSFRTNDSKLMVAHGQAEAAMGFELDHAKRGPTCIGMRLRAGSKEVTVDNEKVTRLAGYIGQFPTVVFSSQDQQLIRGSPAGRRRWMDLTLAAADDSYLQTLQSYHRALGERNALLKAGATDGEFAAFEHLLAEHGARLVVARNEGLERLGACLEEAYVRIATRGGRERPGFAYAANVSAISPADLEARLAEGRGRDTRFRTTLTGPHRDDLEITLDGRPAREVASEGQERSLVLGLRLAQAEWFRVHSGTPPVILADDVLGELDAERRAGFWSTLPREWQVIATGTELPDTPGEDWQVIQVENGHFATEARSPA
ncbi:MAG: DNA replication and repair protein RecF [Opitutaceae bacterium]|nr:DNA replication and repair protein RecF [Opitutaceae bacterium]